MPLQTYLYHNIFAACFQGVPHIFRNLAAKIRKFSDEKGIAVKYEELREHIREFKTVRREKLKFLLSMHSSAPISQHLKDYCEKLRDEYKISQIVSKIKK